MDLRVDDAAMKSLVAKSIVDSLTPEMREKLIADSVVATLTRPPDDGNRYGPKRSPLQQAFDSAVCHEAMRYANQLLSEDAAFKAHLQSLFADVAAKLFAGETRDELVNAIADTIRSALTKDRY